MLHIIYSWYPILDFKFSIWHYRNIDPSLEYDATEEGLYLQYILDAKYSNSAGEIMKLLGEDLKMHVINWGIWQISDLILYVI